MARTFKTLEQFAAEDKRLEQEASLKTFALMRHRWLATLQPVPEAERSPRSEGARFSMSAYARAIGRSHFVVRRAARGWELACQEARQDPVSGIDRSDFPRPASDYLELASAGEEKRIALEVVAEERGVSIVQARKEHGDEVNRVTHAVKGRTDDDGYAAKIAGYAAAEADRQREAKAKREYARERERSHADSFITSAMSTCGNVQGHVHGLVRLIRYAEPGVIDALDPEDIQSLERGIAKMRADLDLASHLLGFEPAQTHDWDAALAALTNDE